MQIFGVIFFTQQKTQQLFKLFIAVIRPPHPYAQTIYFETPGSGWGGARGIRRRAFCPCRWVR